MTSLSDPTKLLNDPCFDPNRRTVIYTFGYRGKTNGPATTAVLNSYLGTKKRNVILLDWQEEAHSGALGIPLGYVLFAVPNAKRVSLIYRYYLASLFLRHESRLIYLTRETTIIIYFF